jgi:8-oxo-dGTP pyrophosphatase MutT (NUDIX family)
MQSNTKDMIDIESCIAAYRETSEVGSAAKVVNPHFRAIKPLRPAAVLMPIVIREDGPTVMFTQRTDHLEHHPGQVSFPGGHVEEGDGTPEETALRETEEEVGLHRRHIDIIGRIDTYLTSTGFSVTPVVARVTPPFEINPDPVEVAEVFEVPLSFLLDSDNHHRETRLFSGQTWYAYVMPYNGYHIWGVTAGMVRNFYEILSGTPVTLEIDSRC